jgi:phosphotransferase system enzyme I (PtsI)
MRGLGVSEGIGIGKVYKLDCSKVVVVRKEINDTVTEINKLNDAIIECKEQIKDIHLLTLENIGEKEAEIFKAQEMMLEDDDVFAEIRSKIEVEKLNCEFALNEVFNKYIKLFDNIENEALKERVYDLKDVLCRLTNIILGDRAIKLSDVEHGAALVAYDISPSEAAQIDKDRIAAIIIETGGLTSHVAIIAKTMEIPTVVGAEGVFEKVQSGDEIICDGTTGDISIKPSYEVKEYYAMKKQEEVNLSKGLIEQIGLETITLDGYKSLIGANIGVLNDIKYAHKNDAESIGLFRSEFLYMSRSKLPTEDEQFEAYKEIAVKMKGKPVVIRTLDIGGDKELPYLKMPVEMNPCLGYRAIRICLDNTDIFKVQLRAILRASIFGDIKILFPMISCLNELRAAKKLYNETRQELLAEGVEIASYIELGIMIEIPSAAIISDILAKEVDFFSIGTNDLIQYTLAVDRMNCKINHLYNQYHPAVIRLIKNIVDNAHAANIKVAMCGEMAGEKYLIPLLIAMGLDEFSMSPSLILKTRQIIRAYTKKECEELLTEVLKLSDGEAVESYLISKSKF